MSARIAALVVTGVLLGVAGAHAQDSTPAPGLREGTYVPEPTYSDRDPIVTIDGGRVRGVAMPGAYVFRGLPYGAPPTGRLRWHAPQPPAQWHGVRDATTFAPSCPQAPGSFTLGLRGLPLPKRCHASPE
jgi:para-nitrobenzyl esterase